MNKDKMLDELSVLQERFANGMGWRDGEYEEALDEAIELIKEMHSADVVKVKHGEWIPVKLGMPEDNVPVNITWVNRNPVSYYSHIKDKPFTATAVYFHGKWYWFSATVTDMLAEYGRSDFDEFADAIEVIAWMPLPEPYEVKAERRETE